jgi:hypothetical protein
MGYQKIRLFVLILKMEVHPKKFQPKNRLKICLKKIGFLGKTFFGRTVYIIKIIALKNFYARHLGVKINGPYCIGYSI